MMEPKDWIECGDRHGAHVAVSRLSERIASNMPVISIVHGLEGSTWYCAIEWLLGWSPPSGHVFVSVVGSIFHEDKAEAYAILAIFVD